ncbi:MAG: VOC family protein [Cytophagaceae bacterium]|nr:VOC family protein [Cytophagaceae bacterium]
MSLKFLGLRTAIYAAPDLQQTKAWYTEALGLAPYFDEPFYVGFNVGGYELGLDPSLQPAGGTPVTYWGVADLQATWQYLIQLGALPRDEPQNVGGPVWVATVEDPFGNVLGLIENPEFRLP